MQLEDFWRRPSDVKGFYFNLIGTGTAEGPPVTVVP